jgi:hypothetical protein
MKNNPLLPKLLLFAGCAISIVPPVPAFAKESSQPSSEASFSLAGQWSCRLDPNDCGIKERWFAEPLTGKIKLPGTTSTNKLGEETKGADKGYLTLTHKYTGPAWYQREVVVPASWAGRLTKLHLERVLWRSTVWVDGRQAGEPIDFLGLPHDHNLGELAPGKHVLTVRVDNRPAHNIGVLGHHYYPGMQTIWNGLVGRLELVSRPKVSLALVRLFPSFKERKMEVEVTVQNDSTEAQARDLAVSLREGKSGRMAASGRFPVAAEKGRTTVRHELNLARPPLPWDEFQQNLYTGEVTLGAGAEADTYHCRIGFRDLSKNDDHLTINGRPLFYRNNLECCIFPLTGHPPTDVASWKRIFTIYKEHGLNGARFHSWTPPEAAFDAADELGMYLMTEHFWLDGWMGLPDLLGGRNEALNAFARREMRTALDHYGNHPSMCYAAYGNELGGDLEAVGEWLKADRAHDPRHLYSVAGGRRAPAADDFCDYGAKAGYNTKGTWKLPHSDWDYSDYFTKNHVKGMPEFCHELGQPVTHPDWKELAKYTGVLQARNLEAFREAARAVGVEDQSAEFQKASGNLNRLAYKYDIEGQLRTPDNGGYSLLSMQDFPGQGEALVGWLDSFYDSKGFLSAAEFRHYGSATVPLVRLPTFVFIEGETLTAQAEIAHYGAAPLKRAAPQWTLRNEAGAVIASGKLPVCDVPLGAVTRLGTITHPLVLPAPRGSCLRLELAIARTEFSNSWDVWVFPKPVAEKAPAGITIATDPEAAVKELERGGAVLLAAHAAGKPANALFAGFYPPFWSAAWFGGDSMVEGAVIQNRHPALALFPTSDVLDRQWQELCDKAHGFVLDSFPHAYRPIVQPVGDFHNPHKAGTIFEVNGMGKGRLLVCGYNIIDRLSERPAASQLRRSLLTYMASPSFRPAHPVTSEWILSTFEQWDKPVALPKGFEKAILYVKAGGRHPTGAGNADWTGKEDAIAPAQGAPAFTVSGATVWADADGCAWAGKTIRVEIEIRKPVAGILKVRFHDWNRQGRKGVVRSEDGQAQNLGAHENGKWLEFRIRLEDCLDGKIVLEAEATSGPNLMITDLALLPRE